MNIVIVGCGSVGSAICTQLCREHHNVTVVDENAEAISEIANSSDVFGVIGNGADIDVLRRANTEHADLLIAVSAMDEINILCCAAARKLGAKHTVARVRNPEYSELMELLRAEMNLSFTINPELTAAREIFRILRFPSAAKIDTFCHGKIELAEFGIDKAFPFCGMSLIELRRKLNINFLVCSVLRDGKAHIPSGDFALEVGDAVCVALPDKEIVKFFKAIGIYKNPVKNVLIAGGSRTAYYLQELLAKEKINATVIEKDKKRCDDFANNFDCTVICDSPSKEEVLMECGLEHTDAFLALSGMDEENAIISMYAKSHCKGKIVTMISRMSYLDLFKNAGLESIVSPKSSTATYILRYVRAMTSSEDSGIVALHRITDGMVEALELSVRESIDGITNVPLKQLKPRAGLLIACIVRDGEVIIPSGEDAIRKNDTVIVVTTDNKTKSIKDIVG